MNIIWGIIGLIVGSIFTTIIFYIRSKAGVLRIDHTDPEKDVYRFEISNFAAMNRRRSIVLKVDHNADLSQK